MIDPLLVGNLWCTDTPGGLDRYLTELLSGLHRRGHGAVAVVSGPAAGAPPGVVTAGPAGSPLLVRLWRVDRAVRTARDGTDVVDSHFALPTFLPLMLGRLGARPLVVHFQGPWADESIMAHGDRRLVAAMKRHVERAVYKRAAEMVTLSAAFKRLAVERYRASPWHISVCPPGVDLDRFQPAGPGDRAAIRAHYGAGSDTTLAVCVRRPDPRMGIEVLIRAWSGTPADHVLLIAGEADQARLQRLRQQAMEAGVEDRVRLLGRVSEEDLVRLYQAADLSIVPSVALEGFGLVVLESLACGTPVITTDAGGLPEASAGLDPTLVVAAGDGSALSARITAAAASHPLPSREACRLYAERFSWDQVVEATVDVYSRALDPPATRNLRAVYLDHCAQMSGGEIALLRTLPALSGVDAHLVLGEDGPLTGQCAIRGVSAEVFQMPEAARSLRRQRVRPAAGTLRAAAQTLLYTGRLTRRLRRLQPDLIHTNSLKSALYGGAAARVAGVPAVWHVHDRIADDYLPRAAVRLVRAMARRLPTAIIANSEATLAALAIGGRRPATVIPSPVDPALLTRELRAATPIEIGIVGRLAPWKGQHVFIQAFARAFPDGDERAVVVGAALFGEDDYEAELHRLVDELGLRGRVEFTGFEPDVGSRLGRMSVLVHASVLPEPFGQVVVEGMAMGLPVAASDAGGPAEVITDGVTGVLYKPGDAEALAAVLKRLAADASLRRRLGAAARDHARRYTPEVVAAEIAAFYRQALGHRWPPEVCPSSPNHHSPAVAEHL